MSSGAIDGRAFDRVASAWLIGRPDDPARTRVLHLFDQPVKCGEISHTGWDESITDGTQVLELKLIGSTPGDYSVAVDGRPGMGQTDANYTLSSQQGTPSEVSATAGQVTLSSLQDGVSAQGSFELNFPGGGVSGEFDAVYCPGGREP